MGLAISDADIEHMKKVGDEWIDRLRDEILTPVLDAEKRIERLLSRFTVQLGPGPDPQ